MQLITKEKSNTIFEKDNHPFKRPMGLNNNLSISETLKHFYNITSMTKPYHNNPYPRGHEIFNFGRPFLDHYYYMPKLFV